MARQSLAWFLKGSPARVRACRCSTFNVALLASFEIDLKPVEKVNRRGLSPERQARAASDANGDARRPRCQRPPPGERARHRAQRELAQRGRLDPEARPTEYGSPDQARARGRAADAGIATNIPRLPNRSSPPRRKRRGSDARLASLRARPLGRFPGQAAFGFLEAGLQFSVLLAQVVFMKAGREARLIDR